VRRRTAWALGLAVVLVLVASPVALGEYRGSDLLGNVSPQSQVAGGLMDRYPLSAYALDYHVDVGVTDPGGVPAMIAQWAAAQLWSVSSFLVKTVIDLFTWAFSLDLLGGANGALSPIAQAITGLYTNVIGQAWMIVAILVAGIWGMWKALVQRRYTETVGGLALSVVFVVVALFFVYQPERTVGEASRWTNTLSLAFLSGANRGSLDNPAQAKRQVADHLFETLVFRPWVALEFGGLSHCVDTRHLDADGFPHPVGPHDPDANICRDHVRRNANGFGGYAPLYLRWPAASKQRDQVYAALRDGKAPTVGQFPIGPHAIPAGQRIDKADAPAVDIQQAGGAFQRLTFSLLVLLGALGAVVLLGFLSLAVILAQVVALVLLGFAPVALVIGVFPGAGHEFFRGWLARLATAVFVKALYSLVLAIVVAVAAALGSSTGTLGFLFAFGLQTIFFWAIFIYRKQLTARLVSATGGHRRMPRMTVMQKGAHAATRPVTALVGVTRGAWRQDYQRQESALAGAEPPAPAAPAGSEASARSTDGHANGNGSGKAGAISRIVDRNGSTRDPAEQTAAASNGHAASVTASVAPSVRSPVEERASEPTPRAMHEDVMRRARELREHERSIGLGLEERGG
jgi:hypothetical protein